MRTGVLSDAYIRKHSAELFPLDAYTHENLYGQPHLEKHGMHTKKKRGRARRIYRPRAPYMMHHELARQLLAEQHLSKNFKRLCCLADFLLEIPHRYLVLWMQVQALLIITDFALVLVP